MSDSSPLFFSSGDLAADRRFDYARDLRARGDLAAAADLLAQAVELAPDFAAAWFALGEIEEARGADAAAIEAYRRACAADASDRHGAALHLMRLGAAPLAAMPEAYVRAVFDQYAPRFDAALVEGLGYRGPDLLLAATEAACRALTRPMHFAHAVDLGCGTGLAARAFAPFAGRFTGIDLSPNMLSQARTTGLYAALHAEDMQQGLRKMPAHAADLVIAADAVVYVAELAPLWREAARVLMPDGLLCFSVETHDGEGVILGDKLRYAHSARAVTEAVSAAGLTMVSLTEASTRREGGAAVPGLIAVARKA